MTMRGFTILAFLFIAAAQIAHFTPARFSSRWTMAGVMLFLGVSCLLAGIGIGLIE